MPDQTDHEVVSFNRALLDRAPSPYQVPRAARSYNYTRQYEAVSNRRSPEERMENENNSLRLASSEDFMKMCEPILWGSENKNEFGELLVGLVKSQLPENRWELSLLVNVAAAQWSIMRLQKLQQSLFHGESDIRGANGVPQGTLNAYKLTAQIAQAQVQLSMALKVYRDVKRNDR